MHLVQELKLKMKPDQRMELWYSRTTYLNRSTTFDLIESIATQMNSILKVAGRDKFENGNGEMTIKLFSKIPVADAKNHEKVNQATLQRYLAEIVWFPSASLSQYIKWDSLGEYSAN